MLLCSEPGCEHKRYHWSRPWCIQHDKEERALADALFNAEANAKTALDETMGEIGSYIRAGRSIDEQHVLLDVYRARWQRHHTLHTLRTQRRPGDALPGFVTENEMAPKKPKKKPAPPPDLRKWPTVELFRTVIQFEIHGQGRSLPKEETEHLRCVEAEIARRFPKDTP